MSKRVVDKPLITLDLDGVLCRPPFGWNVGISRRLDIPPLPRHVVASRLETRNRARRLLALGLHVLRYAGRQPMADARKGLLAIGEFRTAVLVTARNALVLPFVEKWLRRHDLADCLAAVYANDTGLRSAQFKLLQTRALQTAEHVDDDGATADYLARGGVDFVFLRDWPRNRGLPYPGNVVVVRSLLDVAEWIEKKGESN